jgi:hypothetical protein
MSRFRFTDFVVDKGDDVNCMLTAKVWLNLSNHLWKEFENRKRVRKEICWIFNSDLPKSQKQSWNWSISVIIPHFHLEWLLLAFLSSSIICEKSMKVVIGISKVEIAIGIFVKQSQWALRINIKIYH